MRAVLLLDEGNEVMQWQLAALRMAVEVGLEIVLVAHCCNTPRRKVTMRNLPYYGLAWFSRVGLAQMAPASIQQVVRHDVRRLRFMALQEGMWQRIPSSVIKEFEDVDVVVKFGMTLLSGCEELPATHGVLSYHHGTPEHYRGRPSGFYELLHGSPSQGIIVQQLSDRLDGGTVVARAESKVATYSYRRTLAESYETGVPLLAQAVRLLESGGRGAVLSALGPNYRLPAPSLVALHVGLQAVRAGKRILYGAAMEKEWRVGFADVRLDMEGENSFSAPAGSALPIPAGFAFAADPHWQEKGIVICELMDRATGEGAIGRWCRGAWSTDFLPLPGHAAYPQVVKDGGDEYLFPEVSAFSSPQLWRLGVDGRPTGGSMTLKGLENERLVDATLLLRDGLWYLFAGRPGSESSRLDLWVASRIFGPFTRHPSSPVCLSIRGARMGGPITEVNGKLYRFGQDGSEKYGGSIVIHQIETLSSEQYEEDVQGSILLADAWGPHTATLTPEGLLLDFYRERVNLMAGYRRVVALVRRRMRARFM